MVNKCIFLLASDGQNEDLPSSWDWPTVRAANPENLSSSKLVKPDTTTATPPTSSSSSSSTTPPTSQEQTSWANAGQNHLPPRGDITDLVNKGVPPRTSEEEEERRGDGKSKHERLSNGFSDHKTEHNEEEVEEMEVGGASHERGGAINGERREEGEESRNSQASLSEDDLRQSVGSVTSSEFNPNVFGGVREEEMAEGERWPAGSEDTSPPAPAAATDTTALQVGLNARRDTYFSHLGKFVQ